MKAAWITGSAKRLGRSIAIRLAREGYYTFVHYRNSRDDAEETLASIVSAGGRGSLLRGDVGKRESVFAMAKTIRSKTGRLDVLVHNVGNYHCGPLLELPGETFSELWKTNTASVLHLIQAVVSLFPRTGGSFLSIGYSGMNQITGTTHNAGYLATKTALLVLVKSLALELAPKNIRVNMVSPGILDNSVELPRRIEEFAPLGRLGRPEEIAEAVAFLAGPGAEYITGINLDVTGGYMAELKTLGQRDLLRRSPRRKK